MKNTEKLFMPILICLVIAFGGANSTSAQQEKIVSFKPSGSYQQSCFLLKVIASPYSNRLTAVCNKPKTLFSGQESVDTSLENIQDCDGDIANINGTLECNKSFNSTRQKNLRKEFAAAQALVYGKKEYMIPKGNGDFTTALRYVENMIFYTGLGEKFFNNQITKEDIARILFIDIASMQRANLRSDLINQAFREVWGMDSTPKSQAKWDAAMREKLGGYQMVYDGEKAEMGKSTIARRLVMSDAYDFAVGKTPSVAELDAAITAANPVLTYSEWIEKLRKEMYGGNSKLYYEAVKNALENRTGKPPTEDEIKKALTKYSGSQKVAGEM